MKCKNWLVSFLFGSMMLFAISCKQRPSDAELKSNVETAIANNRVMVDVKDGVVTLSGTVIDDASKSAAESSAKAVEDVESVVNSIAVTPPPPVVTIAPDDELRKNVLEISKNYSGVSTSVSNGEITLTGKIKKDELTALMQALSVLQPKKINNQLTVQ